ncbi:PIN domain-containing protein [Neorhizobium sp. BT27B]|uniref:PIN domain-containing protein n=1 Tax=Neorhizobium sp. BT27B TaxID=3142625 RepID=UPI003D284C13
MSHYADRFTVLIDANCLAGALRRNMILSLAEAGFYRVRWSARIMDETARAIDTITGGKADSSKQIDAMTRAFPEATVEDFEELERLLIDGGLRDVGDAHVIAAAIKCGASVIVTDNLRDFPEKTLKPLGLEAQGSDGFIADCIDLDNAQAMAALNKMRLRFKHPELTWDAICQKVEAQGLTQSASMMQKFSDLFRE